MRKIKVKPILTLVKYLCNCFILYQNIQEVVKLISTMVLRIILGLEHSGL